MLDILTVTETARLLASGYGVTIQPHELSTLIYRRVVGSELAPMIGGRRMIERQNLPLIADLIRGRCPVAERTCNVGQTA